MDVRDQIPEDAREIEGIEKLTLTSVGIDIGSSTSHLMFSRLIARRQGTDFSSQFEITNKEPFYRSDIRLTPYVEGTTIDVDELSTFIENAYEEAGVTHADVDTGAVIVTGEAAKKENAARIADIFSEQAGKFVTASAGPTLEAIMAAHGSGAVDLSESIGGVVMNIDIGGGTSKVSIVDNGEVVDTASVNVGARLVATDDTGRIKRAEPTARTVAEMADLNLDLRVGERLDADGKRRLARTLTNVLLEFVTVPTENRSALADELTISEAKYELADADVVTFSGGCSEFVYGDETADFGDLGPYLGDIAREQVGAAGPPIERARANIRATVVGSTQYSVQISGNTIHATDESLLPVRNLQVFPIDVAVGEPTKAVLPRVKAVIERFDLDELEQEFALSFAVEGTVPDLATMDTIADVATSVWAEYGGESPIIVTLDADLAQSVGNLIEEHLANETETIDGRSEHERGVVTVDGIDVGSLEYVDVGEPLQDSEAVPVIVKSLVFGGRSE